ncbi:MAG: tetratricopeptide repeat protein [Acidobacteriales bacterium]|nr:tetratricopeptide repeat protein [Terriglobales bacterium]
MAILLGIATLSGEQGGCPRTGSAAGIRKLAEAKRWVQVVEECGELSARSPEIYYYHGMALAQLGRWEKARDVFLAGSRLWPDDARFPVELGGIAFKQKRYADAARWIRRGLSLNPDDSYATDFLATVYFLQGNLDASLKYWNRVGKPQIQRVKVQPGLRIDPVLLDRAFAFAPGGTLLLPDLTVSRTRVRAMQIFPTFAFRLDAREDGGFDAAFTAYERDGWGDGRLGRALSILRGAAYQTVYPEYFNLRGTATNITSMARWDPRKRRLSALLSGPLWRDPGYRYGAGLDFRDERWDLRNTFKGSAPSLGALNLRRYAVRGDVASYHSPAWSWSVGGEFSYRDYRNISTGLDLPHDALSKGYQLKQVAELRRALLTVPERRFESGLRITSETGTIRSAPAHSFERLQASVDARWMPRMTGDDYAIRQRFSAGRILGRTPFDELFMLGLERDNDLWMRAHIGTRDGRKGSAPLVRRYFLSNWEIDKNLYGNGIVSVKLSPFLDVGKGADSIAAQGAGKWLWDTGVQAKVRVLGVGFMLVYGKDLRSGNNAIYVMAER